MVLEAVPRLAVIDEPALQQFAFAFPAAAGFVRHRASWFTQQPEILSMLMEGFNLTLFRIDPRFFVCSLFRRVQLLLNSRTPGPQKDGKGLP